MVFLLCIAGVAVAGFSIILGWGMGFFISAGILGAAFWTYTNPERAADRRRRRRGGMIR